MGANGNGQEFTLGTVVGEIRALARQTEQMETRLNERIVEVKTDLKEMVGHAREDCQKQINGHEVRLSKREKADGSWRWLERAGMLIGAAIAGMFSGRGGK